MTDFLSDLAARRRFGMKPGLNAIRAVCAALGDPQKGLRAIHVAGTNGKGAVCAMLDACLRAGGLKVGRYTSPHLVRLNERFFLEGRPVGDAALERAAAEVERIATGNGEFTFFEALTAVAFLIYAEAKPDYVVLETGLGGRLDATNVCEPTLCVITRIGLDHCDWLGDTVEKIAAEKAGIVKPGVPVVLGANAPEVRAAVEARAKEVGASFFYAPDLAREEELPEGLSLAGAFNRENAVTALAALKVLIGSEKGQLASKKGRLESEKSRLGSGKGRLASKKDRLGSEKGRLGSEKGRLGSEKSLLESEKEQTLIDPDSTLNDSTLTLKDPNLTLKDPALTLNDSKLTLNDPNSTLNDPILQGFRHVVWPGRFQRVGRYIVDGAHNPPAARALAAALREYLPSRGAVPTLIAGFCGDKDVDETLRILAPLVKRGIAVRTNNPRSLDSEALREKMESAGIPAVSCDSLRLALAKMGSVPTKAASDMAKMGSVPTSGKVDALICGSLFLAGEALVELGAYPWPSDRFDAAEILKV